MVNERQANVVIVNKTGMPLKLVTVVHKYSDDYVDKGKWYDVNDGTETNEFMTVRYHTGFGTTGRDWWLIVMATGDGRVFYSNPNNIRGIFDVLEGFTKQVGEALSAVATAPVDPIVAGVAAALGLAVEGLWATGALNDDSTAGFKQHILTDEDSIDAGAVNKIVISGLEGSDVIEFQSPSGISRTQAARRRP